MGAWIEMPVIENGGDYVVSHPTWVRGLKYEIHLASLSAMIVAPYMGAWIEITMYLSLPSDRFVAPYMGAWIEISIPRC